MPGRIIELLRFKLDNRRNAIVISGFSAGREAHQEGGFHTHILMKFEKKINVNDANFMDVEDEDWKEYQENIEQAKEAGFLIESWPEALDAGGKKKRKGGFEDDEVFEMVKRSRTSEDFLQEANALKPGALLANFHNASKYANWVLPTRVVEPYTPPNWHRPMRDVNWTRVLNG
ncbi:replication-associated protein [Rhizophagus irregularis DAOM 181602=DAOM 197198]|nr:replication-associated protein [Rhizophagus irregularis DAOM 181602=DAOM 197198]